VRCSWQADAEHLVRRAADVVLDTDMLKPFDDVHVDRKVTVGASQPIRKAGTHVEQRPPAAGIAYRCPIGVGTVAGSPWLRMGEKILFVGGHHLVVRHDR
jgi:hypothetical protein